MTGNSHLKTPAIVLHEKRKTRFDAALGESLGGPRGEPIALFPLESLRPAEVLLAETDSENPNDPQFVVFPGETREALRVLDLRRAPWPLFQRP